MFKNLIVKNLFHLELVVQKTTDNIPFKPQKYSSSSTQVSLTWQQLWEQFIFYWLDLKGKKKHRLCHCDVKIRTVVTECPV